MPAPWKEFLKDTVKGKDHADWWVSWRDEFKSRSLDDFKEWSAWLARKIMQPKFRILEGST
jgi:hypothetical protein